MGIKAVRAENAQAGSTAHVCPQGRESTAKPSGGLFLILKMKCLRNKQPDPGKTCQNECGPGGVTMRLLPHTRALQKPEKGGSVYFYMI